MLRLVPRPQLVPYTTLFRSKAGLEALNRAPITGVRALVERAGLKLGNVTAANIGYVLGPRLNAAGRISDAEDRKSTRLNSSHGYISYAVFCLKKKILYHCDV